MNYRQCSQCGLVTDEDELNCPYCGKKALNDKIITFEELIFMIQKGGIAPSKVWIKNLAKIAQVIKGLPP